MKELDSSVLADSFQGFDYPDANFIYCPNQFFDVCLSNCSLIAFRLIGHVLYETHRWRDDDGNPRLVDIEVPQSQFVHAGTE